MKNRAFVVAAVGLAAVVVAGGLIASNMGFKAEVELLGPANAGSNSGTNTLGLPFFQQTNLLTVEDLINDINNDTPLGAGDLTDNVQSISRLLGASDTLETYSLFTGGSLYNLASGQGYIVVMRGTQTNYTVVGSHNPTLGIALLDPSDPASNSGAQDYAMPYHFTGTLAVDLINDIDGQGGVTQSVSQFVKASDTLTTYSLFTGGTNFTLEPGEGYTIVMQTGISNYVPSHY